VLPFSRRHAAFAKSNPHDPPAAAGPLVLPGLAQQKNSSRCDPVLIKAIVRGRAYPARPQGFLPQGAPTSPMLANLAVRQLDDRLQALADAKKWVYTRYADDLAFSTTRPTTRRQAAAIAREVKREIQDFGLICNESKTTIIPPGARKIMLGVLIDRLRPKLYASVQKQHRDPPLCALESQDRSRRPPAQSRVFIRN
jgi:Reverse transcriptase (RNA-dependent DNA polymerase)